ncbi:hypothetical protein F0562_000465 [Nyssa sinensis]|uniref:HR-like lesion-inducer n=1 Tax=Nyssa sinensis TaxID=561372 RepID=A0A5J5C5A9_9ASTE|nr:hypothetical protein F0562_000465 [Nyssa sinensis]
MTHQTHAKVMGHTKIKRVNGPNKNKTSHCRMSLVRRFNEFGVDGGPAALSLRPKFDIFSKHMSTNTGLEVPEVEIKYLVAAAIAMKGIGGLLFIFGSTLGAYLLLLHQVIVTPILYDFYNYDVDKREFTQLFVKFTQNLALFGALLFFIGMKNSSAEANT